MDENEQDVSLEAEEEIVDEGSLKDKIKALRTKLKETEEEKQRYLNNWQRAQADFINIRKRDEEAKKDFVKFASEALVSELLPVADSFNMAFANKDAWEKVDKNWRSGVEYIYSQLMNVLKERGLTEFDPLGEVFDASKHEALGTIAADTKENDHKVLEVIQKGYMLHDKVVRPAKVKVGDFNE